MQIDVRQPDLDLGRHGVRIERLGKARYADVAALNEQVFGESRVIYRLDRTDLLLLVAFVGEQAVGFKVGYGEDGRTYYSAKGGVLPRFRRRGIARLLLHSMEDEARSKGYVRMAFDTFPNMHLGMTVLGLAEGYRVTRAGYNATYRDYRLRLEKPLTPIGRES